MWSEHDIKNIRRFKWAMYAIAVVLFLTALLAVRSCLSKYSIRVEAKPKQVSP